MVLPWKASLHPSRRVFSSRRLGYLLGRNMRFSNLALILKIRFNTWFLGGLTSMAKAYEAEALKTADPVTMFFVYGRW